MEDIITAQSELNCRDDFPALTQTVHGRALVYLDNAASTLKPISVVQAIANYYSYDHANVHRGVHALSERASSAYDNAREVVRSFVAADSNDAVVFCSGTTGAINMVAKAYVLPKLNPGDEILVDQMSHHSNFVPWQQICKITGAVLKVIPLDSDYAIDLIAYKKLLQQRTKFVALTHVSNVLGTINPVQEMTEMAHAIGAEVLIDGAQAVLHDAVSVSALNAEFYVFSAHKLYGPTGVGACIVSKRCKNDCVPYETGGGMVLEVNNEYSHFQAMPQLWEAGTPNIAGAVGFAAAIKYVNSLGMDNIKRHEEELVQYTLKKLSAIADLTIFGPKKNRVGVFSFAVKNIHPHDVATILDQYGVATRAGTHCAMPLMQQLSASSLTRVSLACYNNKADIDVLCAAILAAKKIFGV
jgi:cysteine desulfurase/selenocysteine lyase